MTAIAEYIAGNISAFGATSAGFSTTDLAFYNSGAAGSGVIGATAIAQSTNLDMYGVVSFTFTANANIAAGSWVDVYVLPLLHDGSTYGDSAAASGANRTAVPGSACRVATYPVTAALTIANGSVQFVIPTRRDFKIGVYPNVGTLAAAAAAAVQFISSNENLNA